MLFSSGPYFQLYSISEPRERIYNISDIGKHLDYIRNDYLVAVHIWRSAGYYTIWNFTKTWSINMLIMTFSKSTDLVSHFNKVAFVPPSFNLFFEALFDSYEIDRDSPQYPLTKHCTDLEIYNIFKYCDNSEFKSIFLPALKFNSDDLPSRDSIKNKFALIIMDKCGNQLVLFNLPALFVQTHILKSLAGDIERYIPATDTSSILRRQHFYYKIKVTMICHFACKFNDRHDGFFNFSKKYISDALIEVSCLINQEIENVRMGYSDVEDDLLYISG